MTRERKVRIHSGVRDMDRFPVSDDALVEQLTARVFEALERGRPRPALLALFADRVMQYDLPSLIAPEGSLTSPMIAAVAGQPGIECLALVGTLRMRRKKKVEGMQALAVFIEWPDSRWAMSWRAFDGERTPLMDEASLRCAVDGWPRPAGLGGWFSRARRQGLRLRLTGSSGDGRVH
jgi:hypothetical protein